MKVAPGPPLFQYAGTFLGVLDSHTIRVKLNLGYIMPGIGDQDFGIGLKREDGWLTLETDLHLEGVGHLGVPAQVMLEIARLFPTDSIIVQIARWRTGQPRQVNGRWSANVWHFGEDQSVNSKLVDMLA